MLIASARHNILGCMLYIFHLRYKYKHSFLICKYFLKYFLYSERELNPHPEGQDFKSCASTDSTTGALYLWPDSNRHVFRHWFLRPARLPFHHKGIKRKTRGSNPHQFYLVRVSSAVQQTNICLSSNSRGTEAYTISAITALQPPLRYWSGSN